MKFLNFLCFSVFLFLFSMGSMFSAHAINIVPHEAIYDISMASAKSGGKIINIEGQMQFSWRRDCTVGWITNYHTKLTYFYADGEQVKVSNDMSSVEDVDGKEFSFFTSHNFGTAKEITKGKATYNGYAVFDKPKDIEPIEIKDTLFPLQHTVKVLEKAQKNENFLAAYLFDGSEISKGSYVNAFIQQPAQKGRTVKVPVENVDHQLTAGKNYWPLRLAFWNADAAGEEVPKSIPNYEMSIHLYENGVVDDIVIDYKNFSLNQRLSGLKMLENQACN